MKNKRLWLDYSTLRNALDFNVILNHYEIEYQPKRNQVKIKCPFHDDKNPSLSINISDNKWQCFGCKEKGNALEFITLMEDYDPYEKESLYQGALAALEIMGKEAEDFAKPEYKQAAKPPAKAIKSEKQPRSSLKPKKPISSDPSPLEPPDQSESNPVLDLNLKLRAEHPFLTNRGITSDIAEQFSLGFCKKGLMKDRIAIPIHNEHGELVAYAGRYADEEIPEEVERYRLPKNFIKSIVLFNLHRAKTIGGRHLVLVEGFWSVIRLHLAGIPAVALMGTVCSREQAELIGVSGFRFVTVLMDGDEAGQMACGEIVKTLAPVVYVRQLDLPEGVKPDDMPEAWFNRLR